MSDHDRREHEAHAAWLEQVAPYLDDELSPDECRVMAQHLAGCEPCRRELARQQAVSQRLGRLGAAAPSVPNSASPAATPSVAHAASAEAVERRLRHRLLSPARRRPAPRALWGWTGWGLAAVQACVLAVVLGWPSWQARQGVPMVRDAVADYRQLVAGELPGHTTRDTAVLARTLALPLEVIEGPGVEFLGAWPTALQGQPAAALAYRVEARTVVQYVVSGPLFFNRASVRDAVAREGRYVAHLGDQAVVGWPGDNAGSLLVGELPTDRLERLRL
ncbi:zf-HC2 domain-containing protein [Halomonas sp. CS7]|uniref:Zf-HC2 domain-containing protein n=1 Tax=Halomonas pelophila TaxID=3151122 RepID=A0ABV1N0W9_9GAMM